MRGMNGESKDVPSGTLIVVMFAARPPGVPKNAICAEPETAAAQEPTLLIKIAAFPPPASTTSVVPHSVPLDRRKVTTGVRVGVHVVAHLDVRLIVPPVNHHGEKSVVSNSRTCSVKGTRGDGEIVDAGSRWDEGVLQSSCPKTVSMAHVAR